VHFKIAPLIDEDFRIANGTVSATGTIIDNNNAPTVATILPASATEESDVVCQSNPSVDTSYAFVLNKCNWLECGLHDY
jgi:hypothetical protein